MNLQFAKPLTPLPKTRFDYEWKEFHPGLGVPFEDFWYLLILDKIGGKEIRRDQRQCDSGDNKLSVYTPIAAFVLRPSLLVVRSR